MLFKVDCEVLDDVSFLTGRSTTEVAQVFITPHRSGFD